MWLTAAASGSFVLQHGQDGASMWHQVCNAEPLCIVGVACARVLFNLLGCIRLRWQLLQTSFDVQALELMGGEWSQLSQAMKGETLPGLEPGPDQQDS